VRNHFQILLGPGSDFVPVMLYESRSITPRQRAQLADLQGEYEQPWLPVLQALQRAGRLHGDVKLARLLIFGALNWSAQWFDRRQGASLDDLADAALALFTGNAATGKPR
jgi:TetR/AcrR family transcriptional regulator, cholesterol catabolism regulator